MNKCKIIVYHYVRPIKNSKYQIKGMEVENFEKQINLLKMKYNPIRVSDIINSLNHKQKIPKNSILFTFDDGLKDHYDYVFPILKKNNIEGVFFPSGKPIIEKIVLDVHKIHFILASITDIQSIIIEIKTFLEKNKNQTNLENFDSYFKKFAIPSRFDSKEVNFVKKVLQKEIPKKFRKNLVNQLFKKYVTNNEKKFSENFYLSINNINEMKNAGMVFGSHSYSHYWMSTLNEKELIVEIRNNQEFLDEISGDGKLMCYPHGDYSDLVIKKIKENEFEFGLTTEIGDAIIDNQNRFKLKRFDCNNFPVSITK